MTFFTLKYAIETLDRIKWGKSHVNMIIKSNDITHFMLRKTDNI